MAINGELDKALADLNEAIRLDPKDAGLFAGRAEIYWQLGEREKALADYQEAIRLDPKNVWGYLGLASLYRDSGDLDKALAAFNEAVRVAPQYARFTCNGRLFTATKGTSRRPWPTTAKQFDSLRNSPRFT